MTYQPKNFQGLLGTQGFSDKLLTTHFTLYEGYVKNTNLFYETLMKMSQEGKTGTPEFAELKRRFGWEFNGMRLHEYYFDNMTKEGMSFDPATGFGKAISDQFGSHEKWLSNFKASGTMRGIGWVILYRDPQTGKMFNVWVEEHSMNHLAGCAPLLVLDVFEHAYVFDYGLKRADYIEAFFKALNWETVAKRFELSQRTQV